MKTIDILVKKDKVNLYFLSDIHLGAIAFEEEKFRTLIARIKNDKNALVLVMGDLAEFIHTSDKRYDIDEIDSKYNTVEKQFVAIKNYLSEIKDKIIVLGIGNHGDKIKKLVGFDIIKLIAEEFKVPYCGYSCFLNLTVGKHTYKIFATHGASGSTTLSGTFGTIKKIVDMMEVAPDIVSMGHVHRLDVVLNPKLSSNLETKIKYLVFNGSFYNPYQQGKETYASKKLFSPLPIGCVMFELNNKGKMNDNKIIL